MKISYKWLRELTGLDWPVKEMADRLTLCGTACEEIEPTARYLNKVVVGHVTDLQPVPKADKIKKATVDLGGERMDLVCGAPNIAVGQKVAVALEGAELAGGIVIKRAKIRGIESAGMICAEDELGISADHSGIMVLDPAAVPGKPLAEHLDYDDYVMGFELTPDRADSMSAFGLARDLAALASTKVRYPRFELETVSEKASDHIKVTIENPEACARFAVRIIKNVKIGPSPWWLQKKLLTAGVRPISNIVDVTNLVMIETGNPVHAFDFDEFGSNEVVVRRAREGEKLTTLDGREHDLTPEVLLIANGREAKSAAGVMGGLNSEVTDRTKNILLEVAYFEPSVIRASRKKLGFVSEASARFEKGVDPNNVPYASERVAFLFRELCGADVLEGMVDCYPRRIEPPTVELRPQRCNYVLGTDIATERMVQILSDLEFRVEGDNPLKVTIPTFRHDIAREIDLIEEVARIEGYDSIPDAVDNIGPLFTPAHAADRFRDEIRTVLTGVGFDEMMGHGLADSRLASFLNPGLPQLRIVNPVSEDLDIMRNDLVQTALTVINHNIAHRNLDLSLFELGKAYFPPDEEGRWVEDERLLLLVSGQTPGDWRSRPRPYDYYDLTGALNALGRHFQWPVIGFEPFKGEYFEPELSFSIAMNGNSVGSVGQVKPEVARKFDIKQPVYLAQLRLEALMPFSGKLAEFKPLPVFPSAPRDLALLVDETTKVGHIVELIRSLAGELAESVSIFDLYTGKQVESGKKSVGVAISYRSAERSLSSAEVDKMQEKIIAELKKKFNAEVRDK